MHNKKKVLILTVILIAIFGLGIAFASYTALFNFSATGQFDYDNNEDLQVSYTVIVKEYKTGSAILKVGSTSTITRNYDAGQEHEFDFENIEATFNVPGSYAILEAAIQVNSTTARSPGLELANFDVIRYDDNISNSENTEGENSESTDNTPSITCTSSFEQSGNATYQEQGRRNAARLCSNLSTEWLIGVKAYTNNNNSYAPVSQPVLYNLTKGAYEDSVDSVYYAKVNNTEYRLMSSSVQSIVSYAKKIPAGSTGKLYLKFIVSDTLTDEDRFVVCDTVDLDENGKCKAGTGQKDVISIRGLGGSIQFNQYVE